MLEPGVQPAAYLQPPDQESHAPPTEPAGRPSICISNKLSGEALLLLLEPHFENYSFPVLEEKNQLGRVSASEEGQPCLTHVYVLQQGCASSFLAN